MTTSATFPSKKVGDKLYGGDLDEGFYEVVIIATEDGVCVVVSADSLASLKGSDTPNDLHIFVAAGNLKNTLRDAIADSARIEIDYHMPRLLDSQAALEDAVSGKDVDKWMDGFNIEQERTDAPSADSTAKSPPD